VAIATIAPPGTRCSSCSEFAEWTNSNGEHFCADHFPRSDRPPIYDDQEPTPPDYPEGAPPMTDAEQERFERELENGTLIGDALDDVESILRRYIVFATEDQVAAIALWIAACWAMHLFDMAPYVHIRSPEKQSGKSRLLRVLGLLVPRPQHAANISAAALAHLIDREHVTALIDEIDTLFKDRSDSGETLRGIINAGNERGTPYVRMGGNNMTQVKKFDVFGPKALAGIGKIPDTIRDRSIVIELERRLKDQPVARLRLREAEAIARPVRENLEDLLSGLTIDTWPQPPEGLSDRAEDIWIPLLTIAEVAGGAWASKARKAALALSGAADPAEESIGIRLLTDIRSVFVGDRMKTEALTKALIELPESDWGDLYGKPIDGRKLAQLLKPYKVKPDVVRVGPVTARGYKREDLERAFRHWLPDVTDAGATSSVTRQLAIET
jgi:hypothetical protein